MTKPIVNQQYTVFSTYFTSYNINYSLADKLCCLKLKNRQYICINNWFLSFQQKTVVLVLVAMATDFEHKVNYADEFYKPVKFQANPLLSWSWYFTFFYPINFGSAAMTSYLTSFLMGTRLKIMKMAASLWGGNMTFNCDISRTSWHMKVSDGLFF